MYNDQSDLGCMVEVKPNNLQQVMTVTRVHATIELIRLAQKIQ